MGSAFAWRRATRERETCWCKRGVSLVSGARYRVIGLLLWILWVTGILGDPMYVPCKNCGTKVDPVTALQAPRTAGLPNHPRRRIVLATVTSADHTGELDRVLVDGDRLQLPANVKSKAELLTLLMRSAGCLLSSPRRMCVWLPLAANLGAANPMYQWLRRGFFRKPSLPALRCRCICASTSTHPHPCTFTSPHAHIRRSTSLNLHTPTHLHIHITPAHPHCHSFTSALSFSLSTYLFS